MSTHGRYAGGSGGLTTKKRCKRAVLVSPSRSGLFAFSLVLEHAADLAAWVPIAPVAPPAGDKGWFGVHAAYLQDLAKAKSLSVLAIFGEEDEKGRAVSQRLRQHFPGRHPSSDLRAHSRP